MPKINVYLPDELAEAVKNAGVPVSAVCQRALEDAVRRVTAIRETVLDDLSAGDPTAHLSHFTPRARTAVRLGVEQARAAGAPHVGTEHLLGGMLAEGDNLALRVLRVIEIEPERIARRLAQATTDATEPDTPAGTAPGASATAARATPAASAAPAAKATPAGQAGEQTPARQFSGAAANALEMAVAEAHGLGHNYIGCEHLLLGLLAEPDGAAGQTLRALGADARSTRRAVTAALAGYVHLRAQAGGPATEAQAAGDPTAEAQASDRSSVEAQAREALAAALQPIIERLDRLEQRIGAA